MENKMAVEKTQHFKNSVFGNYIISVCNGAILFFLIDLLFGALTAIIVYAVMKAILWLGQPWLIISEAYIGKATITFCLIYIISIAIVAGWRHFRIIISSAKHIGTIGTANQTQKSEQAVNEAS